MLLLLLLLLLPVHLLHGLQDLALLLLAGVMHLLQEGSHATLTLQNRGFGCGALLRRKRLELCQGGVVGMQLPCKCGGGGQPMLVGRGGRHAALLQVWRGVVSQC